MTELKVKEIANRAVLGITVSRRPHMRYGIKIHPYVEIKGTYDDLQVLQSELLRYSVGCTLRPTFLRIQGIQSCSIMTQFLDKDKHSWWFECLELFIQGRHLTRKGILAILKKRPEVKNQELRVAEQDIMDVLMSA